MEKKAGAYLKGATILAAAGILSRLLGLFFKVPLYYLIGSYGNGIFYNVTNIYNLLLMVSTVGLPVAISKMISENVAIDDFEAVERVHQVSFYALFAVGFISSAILMFGAQAIINMTGWPQDSYWSIIAIAPAPLIISMCSLYRGYFQGFQNMNPTAVSQILEQIVRVALGVFLAWLGAKAMNNIGLGVAGSVFGATAGGLVALLILFYDYRVFHKKLVAQRRERPRKKLKSKKFFLKRLVYIAVPVTLTSAIVSLFSVFDSSIYIQKLAAAGIEKVTATIMMGDLGNAEILINIPLVISGNLAVAIMPSISSAFALGDKRGLREMINLAVDLIIIVGLPCCVGLSVLSKPIFNLLFSGSQYGGDILTWYAYVTIFMMVSNTFQSALQGIDRFRFPLYSLGVGAVIRMVSSWIFMGIPSINIYGIVWSNLLTFVFLTLSNYYYLHRFTRVSIDVIQILKLILSAAVMGALTKFSYDALGMIMPGVIAMVLAIVVAVLVYAVMVILTGALTPEIFRSIPGSGRVLPFYNHVRMLMGKAKITLEAPPETEIYEREEEKAKAGTPRKRRYDINKTHAAEKISRTAGTNARRSGTGSSSQRRQSRQPDRPKRRSDRSGKD